MHKEASISFWITLKSALTVSSTTHISLDTITLSWFVSPGRLVQWLEMYNNHRQQLKAASLGSSKRLPLKALHYRKITVPMAMSIKS